MQDLDNKIEQWKKSLLDLGKRNRLINFKQTKRSNINITFPSYDVLYKKIVNDEESLKFPFPLKTIFNEDGEEVSINVEDGDIKTDSTLNEQQKTLKVLRNRAKTSIEEQGINCLYLTFGIIRWKEKDDSNVMISSPIVLVPVTLTIESITDPYILRIHEDEIVVNPSLGFKFENDFGINLPEFDDREDNIIEYLSRIREITKRNNWKVENDVNLTLLSFLKINMYKDLNNNREKIVSNPIIRAISGDKSEVVSITNEFTNFNHDKNIRPIDTYQVVDADSSQQDAILLSKKGISFVLQGPPGTGKSQTITNIIAEGISDGKKVLFVSEKMAALEVVKKRLKECGLDDFCLTLHSYKANKKDILNQLSKTLNLQKISLREDAIYKLSVLEEKRDKINEYQEQLHEKCLPLNISIYEANGRLAKISDVPDIIFEINNIENIDTELLNKYKYLLTEFSKTIVKLSEDYLSNPWYGCNIPVVTHEFRHDIEVNLNKLSVGLKKIITIYEDIIKKTGANIDLTFENIILITDLLDFSSKTPIFPIEWLSEDITNLISLAQEYSKLFYEYKKNKNNLINRYERNVFELNASEIISLMESNINNVKEHINNKNFSSDEDIILNSEFILNECMEIKNFLKELYNQGKDICTNLGIKNYNSINCLINLKPLIELIIMNPQPIETWFDYNELERLDDLLKVIEKQQCVLNENLKYIELKFYQDITNIPYDEINERLTKYYIEELNLIKKVNNLSSDSQLTKDIVFSFINNEWEKIEQLKFLLEESFEVSKQLVTNIGIEPIINFKDLMSLGKLLKTIIQNPRPTLSWFDETREFAIDKLILDIRNIQKEIDNEMKEVLTIYNKEILNIDYQNMLIRFNTEYSTVLKFFKNRYFVDKKLIKGLIKNPNTKLTDVDIIALLNKISNIQEKKQWLVNNKSIINEILGKLYRDDYTDWEMINKSRDDFKIIKNYFAMNKIPDQLKKVLIEDNVEKIILQYSNISKITESNVIQIFESFFGEDINQKSIFNLIKEINNITSNLINIKNDYDNILKYAIDTEKITSININDIVDVLKFIREVNQKRKWFNDNNSRFLNRFGKYYTGENTELSFIVDKLGIIRKILDYFDKEQIPKELINYLMSYENAQKSIILFKNNIDDISNRNIATRIDKLLSSKDNKIIDFNKIICTLESIEKGVDISYIKYMEFSKFSRNKLQFELIKNDIILLNRIQENEKVIDENLLKLKSKLKFNFKGIDTDWDKLIDCLEYANKFSISIRNYSIADEYIRNICCGKDVCEWTSRDSNKLKEQNKDVNVDFYWFANLFDSTEKFYCKNIYGILDRVEDCINSLSLLEEWIDFRSIRQQCLDNGLCEFIEKVQQINMKSEIIIDTFLKRFYRLWIDSMMQRYPAVQNFRSRSHQYIINEFNELDKLQLKIARLRILEKSIARLPNTNIATSSIDEVGILKREVTKQRKIMPLRRLFKSIPNLLTALKPCLMMSPLSVSLFLQTDAYDFDTVIFDEASQVCTEDAIGAIMRGKQVIIAGDSKQLPPTSFFVATLSDNDFDVDIDDENFDDTGAYDSILEEAINAIPERTLKWHYRSRHEHLIAFSNTKIYNNELITFPSNMDKIPDNGVEYVYVENGIYDRGGKKHNLNEAKCIAKLVFEHIKKHPNRSLGVVTFSEAQQQAVDSAIRQLRLENSQYEEFFSENNENTFFIKNLENVQGDERDTIIFSIGYAKDQNGIMYMNFGPLSRNGGHRRLNVAVTRAKYNVKLVGSIHPTDIKIESTNSEGVKMLRQYIEFAINGDSVLKNELHITNKIDVNSPFEEAVYDFLVKNGYNIKTQVGCSGYRIDMAVKHPTISGIFVLGIECDGATYHSARTARERDRLRQTILEDIGWKIYRIWSTDWIKDPKTEKAKLIDAIEMAILNYKTSNINNEDINNDKVIEKNKCVEKQDYIIVDNNKNKSKIDNDNPYEFYYYEEANVYSVTRIADDMQYLANVIDYVVEKENPIHYELLCKRVAILFGNQKATIKVRNSVEYVLNENLTNIIKKGEFCWNKNIKELKVKIPTKYGCVRTINYISIEELAEAMLIIAEKSFGIMKNDLYIVTARVFGFNRTTSNIIQSMEKAYLYLLDNNRIKEIDNKVIV